MAEHLPVGLGELTGDPLITGGDARLSGQVWYVAGATTGVDGSSPAGLNRTKPLATFAQALSNSSAGDIIVMMDGNVETVSGVTVSKQLTIVGAGTSGGIPTAGFLRTASSGALMTITAAGVELRNLYFQAAVPLASANTDERVTITGAGAVVRGCYFECGTLDDNSALELGSGADDALIEDTTFISTGTFVSGPTYDLPDSALKVSAAISRLAMKRCTLNGGSYGYANPYAMVASAAAITTLKAEQMTLLNGADVTLNASTTGYFHVDTSTSDGSAKVVW